MSQSADSEQSTSELPANGGQFQKGRAKTGGRKKGTLNRTTRAWKDFVTAIVSD